MHPVGVLGLGCEIAEVKCRVHYVFGEENDSGAGTKRSRVQLEFDMNCMGKWAVKQYILARTLLQPDNTIT